MDNRKTIFVTTTEYRIRKIIMMICYTVCVPFAIGFSYLKYWYQLVKYYASLGKVYRINIILILITLILITTLIVTLVFA